MVINNDCSKLSFFHVTELRSKCWTIRKLLYCVLHCSRWMTAGLLIVKILRNRHACYCITEIQICRYNLMQFPVKERLTCRYKALAAGGLILRWTTSFSLTAVCSWLCNTILHHMRQQQITSASVSYLFNTTQKEKLSWFLRKTKYLKRPTATPMDIWLGQSTEIFLKVKHDRRFYYRARL